MKTVEELARHSSPHLTIRLYAYTRLQDLTDALEALPPVSKPLNSLEDVCAEGSERCTAQLSDRRAAARSGDRLAMNRQWKTVESLLTAITVASCQLTLLAKEKPQLA